MNVVSKWLMFSKVSIIGQLYTKRGINYLIRNVMLNPRDQRRYVSRRADLMGSGETLISLLSRAGVCDESKRSSDSDNDSAREWG